ncbi:Bro-N domain-containing protein [uncultured Pseudomonas sp.]|uniref:BRO-N domain-containing protein n=1 Tax=uncultured Pseudomonas sp. TaxID=114707 RepID=UPI00261B85FF|nr:Bro-N domain-containing protein [uncultured Pseudomonas sp.]
MQTAQIIPFKFEAREVRTLLIDDQPWFVATDVAGALDYLTAKDMTRNLDEDEKGRQIVPTLGGAQEMLVINESGLYSAILRSRKAEAKRFKKWITAEVLPAIRKHGSYADTHNKMGTLLGETIGTNGFNMLGALIKGKVVSLPAQTQRKAIAKIWSQTHAAFGVRSAADIPASQLDAARNFIAAYALEGEWLGRDEKAETLFALDFPRAQDLSLLLHYTAWVMHRWNKSIRTGLKELNPDLYSSTWEFFMEAQRAAQRLDKSMPELVAYFQKENGGKRPADFTLSGRTAQS